MSDWTPEAIRSWNQAVIDELRANGGQVGGAFRDTPLLLITTQGRTTGKPHTTPVVYLRDGARYLVFASNAGGPANPNWYDNLLAHPQVTFEIGTGAGTVRPYAATAVPLHGDERDRFWERQCSIDPAFREYQERTTRTIPVVALNVLDLAARPELAKGMGEQLLAAHASLRTDLAEIQALVDGIRAGNLRPDTTERSVAEAADGSLPDMTEELHQACLAYCYGLQLHHIREDGAFSALEDHFPHLGPALDHLRAEHHVVERSLADFETFLTQGPARTLSDVTALDRALAAVVDGLDDHFAYEEHHLLPALGLPAGPPVEPSRR